MKNNSIKKEQQEKSKLALLETIASHDAVQNKILLKQCREKYVNLIIDYNKVVKNYRSLIIIIVYLIIVISILLYLLTGF